MRRFYRRYRKPRRILKNSVIHVPATVGGSMLTGAQASLVIVNPSIDAAGSASANIEAQDKDRTVNVGHHVGRFHLDVTIRNTSADGVIEFVVFKAERQATTPSIGTHPIPSNADVNSNGMQQEYRLANPGKVFHFSTRSFSAENTITHRINVSPAKFKESKVKGGDYWFLCMFNRSSITVTYDFQCRYKEYE